MGWSVGSVGFDVVTVVFCVVEVVNGGRFVGLGVVPDAAGLHSMSVQSGYSSVSSIFISQLVTLQDKAIRLRR